MTFANEIKTIGVKVVYEHEIRRVSFTGNTFSALRELIASLFSLSQEKITIKYKDDEGDLITMSADNDVQEAIKQAEKTNVRTIRLFMQVNEQSALPSTPIPAQKEEGKCEERKKEWKAKREAFVRELCEARGLLLNAKQTGDTQSVDNMRAKIQELRMHWSANRHIKLTFLPTSPAHVIARIPIPHGANIAQEGNTDTQKRKAMWADLRHEIHGNRVALLEAKARGDMQAVQLFREKICKIRQEHRAKLAHCVPVAPLPIGPALGAPGRRPVHPAHAVKCQKRQATCEALRQERQGLLEALIAAKKSGDSHAVSEAQKMMKEFRERAHRARHEGDNARCPPPRVRLPLGVPRPFIAHPARIPAPTPTPTPAPNPASTHVYTFAPAQDWQARRVACEAVRLERAQLRSDLLAAKTERDIPAVRQARAKLCEMRDRQIALRAARAEALAQATNASAPATPACVPTHAPASAAPSAPASSAPVAVTLTFRPMRMHRLAHKLSLRHPCPRNQIIN